MAVHPTYTIDNADGATFRADLNLYIDALVTNNSNPTAPSAPQAGMFWVDTGVLPIILRLRDTTNTLWTPIYNVTNGRGVLSTTAVNTNSINGIYGSTGTVANSIVKNDAVTGIKGDVIGDITGYVNTVGGDNLATILDLSTRSHKNISSITGDYGVTSASVSTQGATTGFEIVLSYKTSFSTPSTTIIYRGIHRGTSPTARSFYVALNTVQISSTKTTLLSAGPPNDYSLLKITLTNITVGDVISIYCDNGSGGNPSNLNSTAFSMAIYIDDFGFKTSRDAGALI